MSEVTELPTGERHSTHCLTLPASCCSCNRATVQLRHVQHGDACCTSVCGTGGGSTGHDRASGVRQAASERPPPRQTVVAARDFLLATRLQQSCKSRWLNKSFKGQVECFLECHVRILVVTCIHVTRRRYLWQHTTGS